MRVTQLTTICAVAACFALGAAADDGHGRDGRNGNNGNGNNGNNGAFESSVVGSVPNTTVGGVASGGVPWVVGRGEASVSDGGRLHVEVSGLLIASGAGVAANLVGTVGPVTMVGASIVCGGSGGSVAASSDGTPLSAAGDAEIDMNVTLPSSCMAPVVLVQIFTPSAPVGSQLGRFIAVSGLTAGSTPNNNGGDHDR